MKKLLIILSLFLLLAVPLFAGTIEELKVLLRDATHTRTGKCNAKDGSFSLPCKKFVEGEKVFLLIYLRNDAGKFVPAVLKRVDGGRNENLWGNDEFEEGTVI